MLGFRVRVYSGEVWSLGLGRLEFRVGIPRV